MVSSIRRRGSKMDSSQEADSKAGTLIPASHVDSKTKTPRVSIILLLALLLSSAAFLAPRLRHKTVLPGSYAICSKEQNIYTVDESNPRVECCVVSDGWIADIGTYLEVSKRWGNKDTTGPVTNAPRSAKEGLKVYYLKRGSILVPGFADAHGHILGYGFKQQLNLDKTSSLEEVVRGVHSFIENNPDIANDSDAWIQGFGWNQNLWSSSGQFPTAADLDQDPLLKGRPIALTRIDSHAIWVSPAVLKLMGDLPQTVEGGHIVRDEDGNPTGIFVDNAKRLVPVPEWSSSVMKRYLATTMKDAVAHGLTSIHDAGTSPEHILFFKQMADQNMLPIRFYVMGQIISNEYWGREIPRLENYGNGRLTVRSVKLVSDGALGSWGAAMIDPYSDKPEEKGLLVIPPDILSSQIHKFFQDGWQVNVHCIGDQANKNVLDIFEDVLQDYNASLVRPRIEHAQLSDLDRIGLLGVIPSVQPTHATSDMPYAELRIGPERIRGAYAYQTLLQKSWGNILPIGSDFPIESIDPLKGFYAAVTRLNPEGTSPHGSGGWYPEEKLSRIQALKGMTYDAAYAAFSENEFGSIRPGLRADLVVLDVDIMTVPENQILKAKVTSTIVDGALVYGKL
ncbi:hypothetical protein Clacol_002486 [Clathrus columnatus]|uniref:Amidohydrolase 3 domain-containing protein n=1 Tax=Clathrus columnatus TaxID=1419009 RepID=A0AAV5A5I8_9AGAM|nr:hypothetical protein Clacol_002486 [Clathrus columnatus]